MKKPAAVKVIHSSKIKASNLKKANDAMMKLREFQIRQAANFNEKITQEDLDSCCPIRTPESMAAGFYAFIKSAIYGPYDTEEYAKEVGAEIAYEMTYS